MPRYHDCRFKPTPNIPTNYSRSESYYEIGNQNEATTRVQMLLLCCHMNVSLSHHVGRKMLRGPTDERADGWMNRQAHDSHDSFQFHTGYVFSVARSIQRPSMTTSSAPARIAFVKQSAAIFSAHTQWSLVVASTGSRSVIKGSPVSFLLLLPYFVGVCL